MPQASFYAWALSRTAGLPSAQQRLKSCLRKVLVMRQRRLLTFLPIARVAGDSLHGKGVLFSSYAALWRERLMAQLDRITRDPTVMGGKPCIRGMRVTVGMIVGQIGAGHSIDELLVDYPYLEREDILQALRYAAWLAEEREVTLPRA